MASKEGEIALEDLREPSAVDLTAFEMMDGEQEDRDILVEGSEPKLSVPSAPRFSGVSAKSAPSAVSAASETSEVPLKIIEIAGLWTPPDANTRAVAIKLLFPKFWEPIAIPEPEPTPPHVAIAFDTLRRKEILAIREKFPHAVMRYGYFTSADPHSARLVANSEKAFEKYTISGERE